MYTILLTVILLVGLSEAHNYWVEDYYPPGDGGIAGYPGCQCSCDPTPYQGGILSNSRSPIARRKKSRRHRKRLGGGVTRGSRGIPAEPNIAQIPSGDLGVDTVGPSGGGGGNVFQVPVSRNSRGQLQEQPVVMDGVLGGQIGDITGLGGNVGPTTNGGAIDTGFDNGFVDNGFDNGFNNGNAIGNDANLIQDTAGFDRAPNVGIRDRFTGDSFTSIGGIRHGSNGYGRHKSKYRRSHRRHRKRKYKY